MADNRDAFQKFVDWFAKAGIGAKAAVVGAAAVVLCGIVAGVLLLGSSDSQPVDGSSFASSEASSMETSSDETSSEDASSEEASSEPESSEVSEPESSEPETSATPSSEPPASSAPPQNETSSAPAASSAPAVSSTPSASTAGLPAGYLAKYADAYAKNPDVVGQIILPGTNLNYYVTQTKDNDFYINHDFNKKYYVWGNPYLDFRCPIQESRRYDNVILYAHSDDTNQLQFAPIKNYKSLNFYQSHPTIQFNTVYQDEVYKVVGFFAENVDQKNSFQYWQPQSIKFDGVSGFNKFITEVKDRSYIDMPVDCKYGDKFITLSTCVSTSTSHSRYVLVARRVRPGESASVNVSAAAINTDQKPPSGPLN